MIHFTDTGREYTKSMILPAANADIEAKAELEDKDMIELASGK